MSNDKNNEFHGEILTPEISRKAIYELGKVQRAVPEVGIFDAPVRCFRVNQEWWALIGGMVHLLADVTAWQDAEDESYPPILAILEFMRGVECADGSEPMLRQKPDDDCVLQQSLDNGETWTDVFDFSLCLNPKFTTVTDQLLVIETQNIINSGYSPTTTTTTGENGAYTDTEIDEMAVEADVCDDTGKDKIYGAVDRLVRYIHNKNVDFLENISQGSNVAEQLKRLISATPIIGLLPGDEAVEYVGFLIDELLDEYNATVDEALLQEVICDLFCIAVNSGCRFSLGDVYNFFAGSVSPTFSNVANTLTNLIQYALTGTFSGDDYFYFLCYFQMSIAGAKQRFLDIQAVSAYEQQMAAGFNSPDGDWDIFCTDCPTQYRLYHHSFENGLGDWTIEIVSTVPQGSLSGGAIDSIISGSTRTYSIIRNFDPSWRIRGAKIVYERSASGTTIMRYRPIANSNTGALNPSISGGALFGSGEFEACQDTFGTGYSTGINQVFFNQNVNGTTSTLKLKEIYLLFEVAHAPAGATITEQGDMCP